MLGKILIGIAIAFPFLVGMGFRVSAAHVFFALMAGELLGRYFGTDAERLVGHLEATRWHGTGEILLIAVPLLLTGWLLRGTLPKRRLVMHAVPLLLTGVVSASFVLPVLSGHLRDAVAAVPAGGLLLNGHRLVVGGLIVAQLVWLWVMQRKGEEA